MKTLALTVALALVLSIYLPVKFCCCAAVVLYCRVLPYFCVDPQHSGNEGLGIAEKYVTCIGIVVSTFDVDLNRILAAEMFLVL